MSDSEILTEEEKQEMLADAHNPGRCAAFAAARRLSQEGTLDDTIDFLSANMKLADAAAPRRTVSDDFRL